MVPARDLLTRFRAGDRDAFTELYRQHHRAVYRFALLMSGDPGKAAEVTQDVFVWLIHNPNKFNPLRGELGSFLIGVSNRLLKNRFARERRMVPLEDLDFEALSETIPDEDEDLARLRQAVAALPPRYREVVVLCDLEEKTYEQAAAIVECAVGTVRSRLHRARALLARKLTGKRSEQRCGV